MANILLLGAGRSASVLIKYLVIQAEKLDWKLTIADTNINHLEELAQNPRVRILPFSIQDKQLLQAEVEKSNLVISMLPALFHPVVARQCVESRRNLITASYVSPEIKALHEEAKRAGLLFMMEAGLDPGIDHMSAMAIIKRIQTQGGELSSFKSYTGGLIAPESDTNPWHYKFTWNPRNVVLAGQGTAHYVENGQTKYIPYQQLFARTEPLTVLNWGDFDGYANRDSLLYQEQYGLQNIKTLVRGTLRRRGYCQAWHVLVQLGLTDDSYKLPETENLTYRQFIHAYLPAAEKDKTDWVTQLARYFKRLVSDEALQLIKWLGFPEEPIGLQHATPAQILEKLLLQKWELLPQDKDMVVMQHLFEYRLGHEKRKLTSSLVVLGENNSATAMAKTAGLPVGIIARLVLEGRIKQTGVAIPTRPEIYEPVLAELEQLGITFVEQEELL